MLIKFKGCILWVLFFVLTGFINISQAQEDKAENSRTPFYQKNIRTDSVVLDTSHARHLSRESVAATITLLRNKGGILPIQGLGKEKIAFLAMGTHMETPFRKGL